MGVWTTNPNNGNSWWRDEFPDTPEGREAAQNDSNSRAGSQSSGGGGGGGGYSGGTSNPSSTAQVLINNVANTPLQGRAYGMTNTGSATANDPYARTHQVYGRNGRKTADYFEGAFNQGLQEFGPKSLSQSPDNIFADSPWARFYRQFYQDRVPAQYLMGRLLNPQGFSSYGNNASGGEDTAEGMQNYLKDFNQNGTGGGHIGDFRTSLQSISDLINKVSSGETDGLDQFQLDEAETLANDPSEATAMITSLLGDILGASGGRRIMRILQSMTDNYYQDAQANDPAKAGPFFNRALKQLGLG